jgi:hypothetical protein
MSDAYGQKQSRFYQQLYRYTHSMFTVGSPVMIVERVEGRFQYTVPHHKQYWLIRDYFGTVVGLILKYKMAAMEIADRFAAADHLFPVTLKNALSQGNHYDEFEIVQSFFRVKDPIFQGRPPADVEIMHHRPWAVLWQLAATDLDKQEPLQIRYRRNPTFVVGDWDLNPQETYSRTPAWQAMADAQGGQAVWKSQLQLSELKARPPIWSLARLSKSLKRLPGQETKVADNDYQYKPFPFGHEGDFMTTEQMWSQLNTACQRPFFVGYFLQLTGLVERGQAPPSPTQIIDMGGEKLDQLSGGIQGYENNTLWTIDDIMFEDLYYEGKIPPPPEKYWRQGNGILIPEFQGPLSQAMRVNAMLSRIKTGFSVCAPLFAMDEMAVLKLKIPELVERIMEEVGIWEDTIRSKDEYDQIVQQMLQKEQQKWQLMQGGAKADMMKNLSKKTDPSSPLALMTGTGQ